MLVYLDGGPLDGQVWDTSALLGRVKMVEHIEFYDWTSGTKEGRSGKVAAIWRYNETRAMGRTE
jgi:hypothetical protein